MSLMVTNKDRDEIARCLDRIQELADELVRCPPDFERQTNVAVSLRQAVRAGRVILGGSQSV